MGDNEECILTFRPPYLHVAFVFACGTFNFWLTTSVRPAMVMGESLKASSQLLASFSLGSPSSIRTMMGVKSLMVEVPFYFCLESSLIVPSCSGIACSFLGCLMSFS